MIEPHLQQDHELPGLATHGIWLESTVQEQTTLARDTYRIRFKCPELASRILPGQFFMIRHPGSDDPLLARPFALYDIYEGEEGQPEGIDVGYHVVGKLTTILSHAKPGERFEIYGPLGNGFPLPRVNHIAVVAGGIGYTPFIAVAREALKRKKYATRDNTLSPVEKVSFLYGVRSIEEAADVSDVKTDGVDFSIATDDGSLGHHGRVTELLEKMISGGDIPGQVFCCGPEPMMEATAKVCADAHISCLVSLETPMACGFGACFSCVVKVRQGTEWDYRRTCVEGPVFSAEQIVF